MVVEGCGHVGEGAGGGQRRPLVVSCGKGQLLAGDILFNNTNSAELVGKSAVVTAPMTAGFSNHLTRVRVDRSRVDPFWLSFWVRKLQASGYFLSLIHI